MSDEQLESLRALDNARRLSDSELFAALNDVPNLEDDRARLQWEALHDEHERRRGEVRARLAQFGGPMAEDLSRSQLAEAHHLFKRQQARQREQRWAPFTRPAETVFTVVWTAMIAILLLALVVGTVGLLIVELVP